MTEAEWLTTNDTFSLYWWVSPSISRTNRHGPRFSRRVGSLFGVACVRATPRASGQPFLCEAAEAAERAADSDDWREVDRLHREAERGCDEVARKVGENSVAYFWSVAALRLTSEHVAFNAVHVPFYLLKVFGDSSEAPALRRAYADRVRDVAGNPFRGGRGCQFNRRKRKPQSEPIFRPEWRTTTVLALAWAMYDSRDFSAMPILADALQDAGCEQPEILGHCRDETAAHTRGCWAIDLVLDKA